MSAIVYLEKTNHLTLAPNFSAIVDMSEIEFYIYSTPGEKSKQVFLIMEDKLGMRDIIELKYKGVANKRPYKIYTLSLNQSLRLEPGRADISLMILYPNEDDYLLTNKLPVSFTTDHYQLARQVAIASELGAKVEGYYKEIVNLFERLINEKGERLNESNNYS